MSSAWSIPFFTVIASADCHQVFILCHYLDSDCRSRRLCSPLIIGYDWLIEAAERGDVRRPLRPALPIGAEVDHVFPLPCGLESVGKSR
jgi:hypothetical protein